MLAKQCDTLGIAQIAVVKQPKTKIVLCVRFVKSYQLGIAVAHETGQITNPKPLFYSRDRQRRIVDRKGMIGLRSRALGPGLMVIAAFNADPFSTVRPVLSASQYSPDA